MKYNPPFRATSDNQAYWNAAPGKRGAAVPAAAIEHPQREILNVIEAAGLIPSDTDLTQLLQSIRKLAGPPYEVGELYDFRHPTLKPNFAPAYGGVVDATYQGRGIAAYPIWEYLKTSEGQLLCVTEAEWQAMSNAIMATLADGTQIRWNGIGGVPFYAPNVVAGTLRLPDVRGMYREMAGFDSLDVGGCHGDMVRDMTGSLAAVDFSSAIGMTNSAFGVFAMGELTAGPPSTDTNSGFRASFQAGRVVPVGNKVAPRAWGALPCVYLGAPR